MSEKERSQFPQQPTQVELERSPATIDGMAGSKALPASTAIPGVNSVKEIRFKPASEDSPNGFFDSINGSNVTTIQMPQAMPLIARGGLFYLKKAGQQIRLLLRMVGTIT